MLDPHDFHEVVSERRRGFAPSLLRGMLRAAEVPYSLAMGWRNRRYDRGHAAVHRVGVPVISVGNLTLGGTGKTPMVRWLAEWFGERGTRVAIVSRGYGRSREQGAGSREQRLQRDSSGSLLPAGYPLGGSPLPAYNDEALELRQSLPDVPHVQHSDRVAAARRAIDEFDCQLVLLDDGFQHRRLARDLDIVLLDALEPFGHEHVFPRGTLREPLVGLRRADIVCLSRADTIGAAERNAIRGRAALLAPQTAWCESTHEPSGLLDAAGNFRPLATLAGRRVAAFCGIGNPVGFRHTLAATGTELVAWREFADHQAYRANDLEELSRMVGSSNADLVVCTHKDLVKLPREQIADRPLWAVTIEMRFLCGQEALEARLADTLRAL